jgi:hypothetical protein
MKKITLSRAQLTMVIESMIYAVDQTNDSGGDIEAYFAGNKHADNDDRLAIAEVVMNMIEEFDDVNDEAIIIIED